MKCIKTLAGWLCVDTMPIIVITPQQQQSVAVQFYIAEIILHNLNKKKCLFLLSFFNLAWPYVTLSWALLM